jgi:hypothetical protein
VTDPKSILYIDNSTAKAEARCSTEVMLRYAWGYVTPEDRAALRAGTAYHQMAEVHFKGGSYAESLEAFQNSYRTWSYDNVAAHDRLSYDNLVRIVSRWLEQNPVATRPYIVTPSLIEVGFAFPLVDDGSIIFCGRLDGVVEYQGALWVLEHKTTGQISAPWLDAFSLDSQLSGYIWAAQQHVGKPVAGAFLNAVEFSKLPGGITPGGQAPKRCPTHKVLYDECGDLHATFQTVVVSRTPDQLEEWRKSMLHLARRYEAKRDRFPTIESLPNVRMQGMFNAGTVCRWCSFRDFCKLGRPMSYITDGNLVLDPWSPYDHATALVQAQP